MLGVLESLYVLEVRGYSLGRMGFRGAAEREGSSGVKFMSYAVPSVARLAL